MRIAPLSVVLLMLALLCPKAQSGSMGRRQFKENKLGRTISNAAAVKTRNTKRELLIKCCGKESCSKMMLKKKPISTNRNSFTKKAGNSETTKRTPFFLENELNLTLKEIDTEADPQSSQGFQSSKTVEHKTSVANNLTVASSFAEESTTPLTDETGVNENFIYGKKSSAKEISAAANSSNKTGAGNSVSASFTVNKTLSPVPPAKSTLVSTSASATSAIAISESLSTNGRVALSTVKITEPLTLSPNAAPFVIMSTAEKYIANAATSSSTSNKSIANPAEQTKIETIIGTATTLTSSSTLMTTTSTTPTTIPSKAASTLSTTTSITSTTPAVRTKAYTTVTTRAPKVLPSCPLSPLSCMKDNTMFRLDGTLDEPSFHGFWESGCGEQYIFGKSLANWEQNMEKCCSLGMTPLTMESKEKSACFDQLINGVKWKYNSRYWSSGLRSSATEFKWCSSSAPVNPALWVTNEPDNFNASENCAQLVISKTNSSARLQDKHCGNIAAFACQGPTTPKPPCEAPTCPNVTCEKAKEFYTVLNDGKTSYLTNPSQHGYVVPYDNRTFVFSFQNDTRTFQEAYSACCSIGMKLLSLHQAHKYKSTMGALKSANLAAAEFWTSGTDLGCVGNYGYCSSTRLLREEAKWDTGKPDNLTGNKHCISINLQYKTAVLRNEMCEAKKRYICEARQASGSKIVEIECGAAFNLTSDQIKTLMVSMPDSLEEKCFLKCFGEGTDMFMNGRLAEDKIFAQFTSVSAGDMGKLMEMFSTMNFCATGTRGMDACDKASQLLKCGKENSPELLTGVLNNLENMIKEAPLILPPTAGVCPEFTCVIDDGLKLMFDQKPPYNYISDATFTGYITHSCDKKYMLSHVPAQVSLDQGMEFCCKFGLRLLTITTQAQLLCLTGNHVYGSWGPTQNFLVAATRLGNLPNPKWCFSDTPFYPTFATDSVVNNTDPMSFLIVHSFGAANPGIFSYSSPFTHVACESIN